MCAVSLAVMFEGDIVYKPKALLYVASVTRGCNNITANVREWQRERESQEDERGYCSICTVSVKAVSVMFCH
jgi:hypothetical protein